MISQACNRCLGLTSLQKSHSKDQRQIVTLENNRLKRETSKIGSSTIFYKINNIDNALWFQQQF